MAIVLFLLLLTLSQAEPQQVQQNLTTNFITLSMTNAALDMMTQYNISCRHAKQPAASCNDTTGDIPAWWKQNLNHSLLPPVKGDSNYVFTGIVWELGKKHIYHAEPYGVVAVNSATNSVYLAFHGTITTHDYVVDGRTLKNDYSLWCPNIFHRLSGNVHSGWHNLYKNIKQNVLNLLTPTFNKQYTLYISGHSLGASLSNFAMADYYCSHLSSSSSSNFADVILYNTAAPNIGDLKFQSSWNSRIPADHAISLINIRDPIPFYPHILHNYYPVGTRFNYSVNWDSECVQDPPSLYDCTWNHDPKCVYYYAVTQFLAGVSQDNACNCFSDKGCDLCIPNTTHYPFGCPILKGKRRNEQTNPENKVELRNVKIN